MTMILVRYVKFLGTSIVGTIVDMLVLWLLSDIVFTKDYWKEYILSPVMSFQCAIAVNYIISYFYVWSDRTRNRKDTSVKRFFKLYLTYNLSSTGVFLVRLGVLLLIEIFTGWDVLICNLLAMSLSGIINFILNNLLVFKNVKGSY